VLRIATLDTMKTEAESRRAQQDAHAGRSQATITRYLSYAMQGRRSRVKSSFPSAETLWLDDRSNALIIEDIPAVLPKLKS